MPRRFIAGAVCPKCEQMDKIYIEGDGDVARCAACGYELQQPDESENTAQTMHEQQSADQAVTLVNFKNKDTSTDSE